MKTLGLSLAAVFAAASFGWAQAPAATQAPAADAKTPPKSKMHRMNAEIVSVDQEKKTVTVKVDGAEKTSPVGPIAVYTLKKLKAGDKVVLTCRDDATTGAHTEIAFIRLAPPEVPKDAAAPAEKKN